MARGGHGERVGRARAVRSKVGQWAYNYLPLEGFRVGGRAGAKARVGVRVGVRGLGFRV